MRDSIIKTLRRFEAEEAVSSAKLELEHRKLRLELIEKYGADAMDRKDKQIEREWNAQHRA